MKYYFGDNSCRGLNDTIYADPYGFQIAGAHKKLTSFLWLLAHEVKRSQFLLCSQVKAVMNLGYIYLSIRLQSEVEEITTYLIQFSHVSA